MGRAAEREDWRKDVRRFVRRRGGLDGCEDIFVGVVWFGKLSGEAAAYGLFGVGFARRARSDAKFLTEMRLGLMMRMECIALCE